MSDESPPAEDRSKGVREDLDFVSTRISEQVRSIAFGILAFVWLFLAGGEKVPVLPSKPDVDVLLLSGFLSLLTLVADYVQYVAAFFNSRGALSRSEQQATENGSPLFDYSS